MKVYKNPFVSWECYFVRTGKAFSHKNEASKSNGYVVECFNGKWEVRTGCYYDFSLRDEMQIVAENRISIQSVIDEAILNAVLQTVKG
ncbi:MAG: hypothetical protein IKV41_05740 [Oscillospiraceae bacterium]|nr:hypothetical protein [Oscillospiraceae bacterium]